MKENPPNFLQNYYFSSNTLANDSVKVYNQSIIDRRKAEKEK